jgi:hypothetical protein
LTFFGEISQQAQRLLGMFRHVVDKGSDGHRQEQIRATVPSAIGSFPVLPASRTELVLETVIEKGIGVRACYDEDRPAVAAVSATRPATGDPFFTAKRETSASTIPSRDVNVYLINEHS